MAKSKNHTNHNQNYKDHRNRIKRPRCSKRLPRRGVCQKFLLNLKFSRKNNRYTPKKRPFQYIKEEAKFQAHLKHDRYLCKVGKKSPLTPLQIAKERLLARKKYTFYKSIGILPSCPLLLKQIKRIEKEEKKEAYMMMIKKAAIKKDKQKAEAKAALKKDPKAKTPIKKDPKAKTLAKDTKKTPAKDTKKTPAKDTKKTPAKDTKKTPAKDTKKTPAKDTKKTPAKDTKKTPTKDTKKTPTKDTKKTPKKDGKVKEKTIAKGGTDKKKKRKSCLSKAKKNRIRDFKAKQFVPIPVLKEKVKDLTIRQQRLKLILKKREQAKHITPHLTTKPHHCKQYRNNRPVSGRIKKRQIRLRKRFTKYIYKVKARESKKKWARKVVRDTKKKTKAESGKKKEKVTKPQEKKKMFKLKRRGRFSHRGIPLKSVLKLNLQETMKK